MKYVVERTDAGSWAVTAYNEQGQVGAKILCSSTTQAMDVFLLLAGHITLTDERTVTDEITQKIEVA